MRRTRLGCPPARFASRSSISLRPFVSLISLQRSVAPFGRELAVGLAVAQDHQRAEVIRLGGQRLDLPEPLERVEVLFAFGLEHADQLFARGLAGEEELEERLVAELVDLLARADPGAERLAAVLGDRVHGARPLSLRLVGPLDQTPLGQPLQLGIDLAVARRPEEPGRLVDHRLDVVARAGLARDEPENHASCRRKLHVSDRYIKPIGKSSVIWRTQGRNVPIAPV